MNTNKTLLLISVAVILLLNSAKSAEFEGLIPKWQTRLTENFFEYRPLEYSGCVADSEYQRVFLTNRNGEIISLSSANGEVQWRFSLKHPIHLRPELKNGTLFAASTGGEITALDVSKKYPSLIWKKEIPGGIISDITLSHSEVILLTERNTLYSISAKDGSVIFQVNNDLPEGFTVYTNTPVIVSGEKIIYTLSTGELYILNRADGKLISKVSIYSPDDRIDGFTGLEADENSILLSTQSGLFYRIETKSGKIIWSRTLSQIARIARDRESANIYVFHSDGTISIYDFDGKLILKRRVLKKNIAGADINGKRIIVRYSDGKILLFSKDEVMPLSSLRLSSPVFAGITYEGNYAYLFTSKGSLIKFLIK